MDSSKIGSVTYSQVGGVIDRISDLGGEPNTMFMRLEGSPTLYRVPYNKDGNGGASMYMARQGDRITLTVRDGQEGGGTMRDAIRAESVVNHSY